MTRPRTKDTSTTQGFTRADLMACLAALTVLTALAASGISSSKDNVNRMVCGSNLRQLAMAVGMYANDNQDYMPYCNWDGGAGTDLAPGWLYTHFQFLKDWLAVGWIRFQTHWERLGASSRTTSLSGLPDSAWKSGSLFVSHEDASVVFMSHGHTKPGLVCSLSFGSGRNNRLSSYVMNGASCNFGNTLLPQVTKVSDVWNPNCYLAYEPNENTLGPNNPGSFEYNDGANSPSVPPSGGEGLGVLHGNNGSEIVTVGGNVNFVLFSTFNAQGGSLGSGPNGQSLAWWAPRVSHGGFQ